MFRFNSYRFPDLVEELGRMNRIFGRSWEPGTTSCGFPTIDVYDTGEAYLVRAALPGVDSQELEIEATARSLSIKGERTPAAGSEARYRRRERETGGFARSIRLPAPIDADGITATYEDGMLQVTLPKAEEVRPRRVAVA
jgi:HSP20 family protein